MAAKTQDAAGETGNPDFAQSFDATDWARAFVQKVSENPKIATDESCMASWFANAIMRGYDEHARRCQSHAEPPATPRETGASTFTPRFLDKLHEEFGQERSATFLEAFAAELAVIAAAPSAPQEPRGEPSEAMVLREYYRKLVEVWGKEEHPHAVAYGWVKSQWDAVLAATRHTQGEG